MARIEPLERGKSGQGSHGRKAIRTAFWILKLPFRITFRFLLFALAALIIIEVARTGIWDVPVISDIFYDKPQPLRQVSPEPYSLQLLALQTAEHAVATSFQASVFPLSEEKLTALIQELLKNSNQPFANGQAVIEPSGIEFYANLKARPQAIVTAELLPRVNKDGSLRFDIESIKIGQVRIPQSLVSSGITSFLGSTLSASIFSKMKVSDIKLTSKTLNLHGITL